MKKIINWLALTSIILIAFYFSKRPSETESTSTDLVSMGRHHSQEALEYYKEICLHDEYGGVNKAFKWKRDVKIYVHGSCPQYLMDELDKIVKDLNEIINTIEIKIVKNRSESNTFIFLGSKEGFKTLYPQIQQEKNKRVQYTLIGISLILGAGVLVYLIIKTK
jgi:hypothetical protein